MKASATPPTASAARRLSRREFFGTTLLAGLAGGCASRGGVRTTPASTSRAASAAAVPGYGDNIYSRLLGVEPHLPAFDHITRLGGSRMPDEVIEAMVEANRHFVDMDELTVAAGRRVAEVMHAEDALVTCGSSSAMLLGAAACLTGASQDMMSALPHPTWPRRECLVQAAHRVNYDPRLPGGRNDDHRGRDARGVRTRHLVGAHRDDLGTRPDRVPACGRCQRHDTARVSRYRPARRSSGHGRRRGRGPTRDQPDAMDRHGLRPRRDQRRQGHPGASVDRYLGRARRPHRGGSSAGNTQCQHRARHEGRQGRDRRFHHCAQPLRRTGPRRGARGVEPKKRATSPASWPGFQA